jgi:hypothetical protein
MTGQTLSHYHIEDKLGEGGIKDPERRSKDMAELKLLLEEIKEDLDSGISAAGRQASPAPAPRRLPFLVGGVALAVAWMATLDRR